MPNPEITIETESSSSTLIFKDLILIQLVALVITLDQFTKFLVREFLFIRESFPDHGFFRITHTFNTGSAFGIFQGQNGPLILVSLVGIAFLFLIYQTQGRQTNLIRLSLGLQIGGAFGNLLDRVRLGHVTDFIDIGPWPVFNLADASIVCGIVFLAWLLLGPGRLNQRKATEYNRLMQGEGIIGAPPICSSCDSPVMLVSSEWRCSNCGDPEEIKQLESFSVTPTDPVLESDDVSNMQTSSEGELGPSE
jgi:signal peptidase II